MMVIDGIVCEGEFWWHRQEPHTVMESPQGSVAHLGYPLADLDSPMVCGNRVPTAEIVVKRTKPKCKRCFAKATKAT